MSDELNEDGELTPKQILLRRCAVLGLSVSNNSSEETLRAKIREHMASQNIDGDDDASDSDTDANGGQINALTSEPEEMELTDEQLMKLPKIQRDIYIREKLHREQMVLVRCRITNLDPKKKDLLGEIITVANEYIGTVRKYIPYGEATDNGYHLPKILFDHLNERQFLHIQVKNARVQGRNTESVGSRYVKEFSLEVMDPLTPAEIKELAQAQIAAGSIEANQ